MNSPAGAYQSPLEPRTPDGLVKTRHWGRLYGSSYGLAISRLVSQHHGLIIVITEDTPAAFRMEQELKFYLGKDSGTEIRNFPDWETLPYDIFSPHQDIISQRLETLYRLPDLDGGILIAPVATIMHRLVPVDYIQSHCLIMATGDSVDMNKLRQRFESGGYTFVHQVMEHGEYAIRGSLMDIFPMGSAKPYRIDLFDDEIESIRIFDPETQRTIKMVGEIHLLPARETPLTDEGIQRFRQNYRQKFAGNPQNSTIYRDVSNRLAPNGIEYYLSIFYEQLSTLFDYLPENCLMVNTGDIESAADDFWHEINERHDELRHDIERPILTPGEIAVSSEETIGKMVQYPGINLQRFEISGDDAAINFATAATPRLNLNLNARTTKPGDTLKQFIDGFDGRILLVAETTGRREMLLEMLREVRLDVNVMEDWPSFIIDESRLAIVVAPLDEGLLLESPSLVVLAESQLFGEQVMQRRRRRARRDSETIIRNLTELELHSPVVHEEHGVGRYLGLQRLDVGKIATEFLTLEYAGGDKLYVPVSSLHLISRYTGVSPESAPLHKLGTERWQKAKRKANEKAYDVAVELLDIYARREARKGLAIAAPDDQYAAFAAAFPFEETPDQEQAIIDTIGDMQSDKPMDRLICGDVGFGKTEVAMRAAFLAAHNDHQVAVLVPTTLLAQQHYQNFKDRFADWPVRVEMLSRFVGKKKQQDIIEEIEAGKVDIVIGTHKLLQNNIHFRDLGLVILDEEHRFGVRQKERLKSLRSEVDILTLTATPIPRTLNMSLSQIRDTAPTNRIAIKTFVREWNDSLIHEACHREVKRGGQVYFLHNEVRTIEAMADST